MTTGHHDAMAGPRWSGRSLLASAALTLVMFCVLPLAYVLTQPDVDALIVLRDLEVVPLPSPPPVPMAEPPPPVAPPEVPLPIELPSLEPQVEPVLPTLDLPAVRPTLGWDGGVPVRSGYWPVLDGVYTMTEVDVPPRPLVQAPPIYPPAARRSGFEGTVVLEFVVTESGTVEQVRVVESRPGTVFVAAAQSAVERWRFQPAQYRGEPVAVRVNVPLEFRLGD